MALSFLSYNIKTQENLEGLIEGIHFFKHVELLALQEVRLESEKNSLLIDPFLLKIKRLWPYHCETKVNSLPSGAWEAQMIFSRHKIQKCGFLNLHRTGSKKRVALWAKIFVEHDQPILFMNTDHETDRLQFSGYPDRQKQLQTIVLRLNNCQQWLSHDCQQWPTIVAGDFNTSGFSWMFPWSTWGEVEQTIEYLKTADLEHVPACDGHRPTFQAAWGGYELDHFFVKNIRPHCRWTIPHVIGSDHFPIWSQVRL